MATKTTPTAAPELRTLDLGDLVEHPKNVRRDVGDVTELAASIEEQGILEPLIVAPNNLDPRTGLHDGTFVVIAGHRRLAAARVARLDEAPCIVRHDLTTDADIITAMLVENGHRADLTPVEEAAAYQQLLDLGATATQVAKRTGRSKATVAGRLNLMRLPEGTREKIHHRQITLEDAAALAEFADSRDTLARLEMVAGTSNFRWELERARRTRQIAVTTEATRERLTAEGCPVVATSSLAGWWQNHTLRNVLGDDVPGITDDTTVKEDDEARRVAHLGCPGHGAVINEMDGRAVYVCTTSAVHAADRPDDTEQDSDDEPDPDWAATRAAEQEARAAAARQTREDVETAAGIRRDFIADLTTGTRHIPTPQTHLPALELAKYLTECYAEVLPEDLAPYLRVTLTDRPDGHGDDRDAWHDECVAAVEAAMDKHPAGAALAVYAASVESGLTQPWQWDPTGTNLAAGSVERRYLGVLVSLGYELTDWESDRIARADAHAAEKAAAASAAAEDDDEDDDEDAA